MIQRARATCCHIKITANFKYSYSISAQTGVQKEFIFCHLPKIHVRISAQPAIVQLPVCLKKDAKNVRGNEQRKWSERERKMDKE